jgi:starch phosphorylase
VQRINKLLNDDQQKIAYFSMEIALRNDIPTYCGGLGVLAGDMIRSSTDLGIPFIGVTLVSRSGYFCQELTTTGQQIECPEPWDPSSLLDLLPTRVQVPIQGRAVEVQAWLYAETSRSGCSVPILFLDTAVEGNTSDDQNLTSLLYGGDAAYRLKQEIVLGIGGVKMLDALDIDVRKYHMNEGHSSLLGLELLRNHALDINAVRELCVFTTHTPVEAAHDKFSYDLTQEILGEYIPLQMLQQLGGDDVLNTTVLALNLSSYCNGVTRSHQKTSEHLFPNYKIDAITNGVHPFTWTCPSFQRLYDHYLPQWSCEPELLSRADIIPDEEIWQAHMMAKLKLIDRVNELTDAKLDFEVFTLGFARRATPYKRANLFFSDLERLRTIGQRNGIQIIYAGKSHINNILGKRIIEELYHNFTSTRDVITSVYLQNYNLDLAMNLISGVDVWLNTPLPPLEASGTSGMKAAHNGVLNFSILDGWWVEGWIEDVTGWAIGPHPTEDFSAIDRRKREIDDLYNKLEYVILPQFYRRKNDWIAMMKQSIAKIAPYFNSHRMLQQYLVKAYY